MSTRYIPNEQPREDGSEDRFTGAECGWNGSLSMYVHEERQADPCPEAVRVRLLAVRAMCEAKVQHQRARGLIA